MDTIHVSEVVSEAWDFTKKHWLKMLLINLFVAIIGSCISVIFLPSGYWDVVHSVSQGNANALQQLSTMASDQMGTIISYFVNIFFAIVIYNAILLVVRGKEDRVSVSKGIALPVMTYLKIYVAMILVSIVIMLGFVLCIIPGIWVASRLCMTQMILIEDENIGVIDAIKKSWTLTDNYSLKLIGLAFVGILLIILGYICCCVGWLITMTIFFFMIVIFYVKLTNLQPVEEI